jgi:putative peptidoglycan lipid II flippase
LTTGSISWLYFSDRLVEFPLGVFGIALATAVLPNLSEKHARGSSEKFSDTLDWSMRCILLITLPAAIGLIFMAMPILTTLFHYKAFNILDVLMTGHSLRAYAIGLPAFVLIKILSAGYFSRQDTKTPVTIGLIAVVANIVLNLLFVWLLFIFHPEYAHVGLALATSFSAWLQAFLLFRKLKKIKVYQSRKKWSYFIAKILLALAAMIGIIMFGVDHVFVWQGWGVFDRVLNLILWVLVSMLSYFSVLWLTGLRLRNITAPE